MNVYGRLTDAQTKALGRFVEGKEVYDLGCGPNAPHARRLLDLGARHVVGVDREIASMDLGLSPDPLDETDPRVTRLCAIFFQVLEEVTSIEVAFVSWPTNGPYDAGLVPILAKAEVVVYLGCNFDGTSCGTPDLFKHLLSRELLAVGPDKLNSMIVVGKRLKSPTARPRKATPEEIAGLETYEPASKVRTYSRADWAPFKRYMGSQSSGDAATAL